ncbi:MAG TPA: galactonate dehydratase [Microlunatus sp.]
MKITSVDTFALSNRRLLVKITASTGQVGWGEATLENWVRPVAATVEQMAGALVGEDPRRITHLWQVLSRGGFYRGGPVFSSAVSGIDIALWDLVGRSLGAPIHDLLGGAARERVRVYAHSNRRAGHTGDPERAAELVRQGYTMIKVAPPGQTAFLDTAESLAGVVADLTELRAAIGPAVDFAVDLHGRYSVPQSRRLLQRIADLDPIFVEEPLRPEHSALIGDVVNVSGVPIATGERLYHRTEFRPVLEAGVAVVQPDLAHAGGISECFKIATQAEIYDAQVAPHCPLGPVAFAACLQIDFAAPNALAQECVIDLHAPDAGLGLELLDNPQALALVAGQVERLSGPGLGIDINEDAVRAAVMEGSLPPGSPTWNYADGSFAEW